MIEYATRTYDNELLLDEISGILKEDGRVLFKAKGRSMRPFIRGTIDSVMLERRETFRVGDVVLAKINGNYILHRIFSLDGDKVVLMGDGNIAGKEFCTLSDLRGAVIYVQRPSGKRINMSRGKLWRLLLPVRKYLLYFYDLVK